MGYMRYRPSQNKPLMCSGSVNQYWMGLNEMLLYIWEEYKKPSGEELWKGLEIGAYMGESTQIFLSSGLFRGGFTVIDSWTLGQHGEQTDDRFWVDIKNQFEHNVRIFEDESWWSGENLKVIRGWSQNSHVEIKDDSLDFIYIDGDHSYEAVKRDLELYLPKLKKGGLMCGHDYDKDAWLGCCEAIDEVIGKPEKVFMDSSWIKQIY